MELRHTQRRQQQQSQARAQPIRPPPPTGTTSSASSSLSQSAASNWSLSSPPNTMLQVQSQQHQPGLMSAPLPSPSATHQQQQMTSYFSSLGSQQQAPPPPHPTGQQSTPLPQTSSERFIGQRGDGGGIPETAPFLKDFNLVAEAAKRAQMACLARDFGDVGL